MELKMKYHYSYFIYPYVIKEDRYSRYIKYLIENSKCTLKVFEKRKNFSMYNYFLPTAREYMFKSFEFGESNSKAFKSMDTRLKANLLSNAPCTIFEYDIMKDIQAKTAEENGIFFSIRKIEIICLQLTEKILK